MAYVISKNGNPLMPCVNAVARLLLKDGKAKCIRRTPFTIKLLNEGTEYTQPLTHGLDAGSGTIGSAVVDEKGKVVYAAEIEVRNDIKKKMDRRLRSRRFRRYRKTRGRKARFNNRGNSKRKDRISPTVTSKVDSHLKEIAFVNSILPISELIIETAQFDTHAMKNPEVLDNKWLYQKGTNYGYANTKAYVRARDGHKCHHCKGKSKDPRLHVHHIIFREHNGSDEPENLITLCETCHEKLHAGKIKLNLKGKKLGTLNYATQMNVICSQLRKKTNCEETYGFATSEHRLLYNLPKEHYIDAALVATRGVIPTFNGISIVQKKCVADGDYRQTRGKHSQIRLTTGKVEGFRKFDKVKYKGKEYFIKGKDKNGYAQLMGIDGKKQPLKPIPKFSKMTRLSARKSWIVTDREKTAISNTPAPIHA